MSKYRDEWAEEVRAGITSSGLTQTQTAKKIGCSKGYITDWLTGKVPSRHQVEAWAAAMGRDLDTALRAAGHLGPDFSPAVHLFGGLIALEERYGVPILRGFHLQGGFSSLTQEEAESVLQSLELLLTEKLGRPNVG